MLRVFNKILEENFGSEVVTNLIYFGDWTSGK